MSSAKESTEPMKLPPVVERITRAKDGQSTTPICILMVGMAGSGKTTLMAQLQQSSIDQQEDEQPTVVSEKEGRNHDEEAEGQQAPTSPSDKLPAYCLNLDPATIHLPYNVSIDIRDTVDYKVCEELASHFCSKFRISAIISHWS